MDRRAFLGTLALALLAAPLAAEAQQAGRVYRIGVLGDFRPPEQLWGALVHGLRERGWVPDQNIAFEYRYADRPELLPRLAADLVRLNVDVIVTTAGWGAVRAAKEATTRIPIVTLATSDPVLAGVAASVMRPGGNVTGLSDVVGWEIVGKRLEFLKQLAPSIRRVAWMHGGVRQELFKDAEAGAKALGITLLSTPAERREEFPAAFAAMIRNRADGALVNATPVTYPHRGVIVELAARNHLPTVFGFREAVDDGGLISYGVDYADLYRRGASYVDKVLRGAKAGELPIELPTKFELVINGKTAKALGLTISQSLRLQADQVIE